jgi:hypothetical protein
MREDGWGRKIMGERRVERVHCWGIREVARGDKISLGKSYEGIERYELRGIREG